MRGARIVRRRGGVVAIGAIAAAALLGGCGDNVRTESVGDSVSHVAGEAWGGIKSGAGTATQWAGQATSAVGGAVTGMGTGLRGEAPARGRAEAGRAAAGGGVFAGPLGEPIPTNLVGVGTTLTGQAPAKTAYVPELYEPPEPFVPSRATTVPAGALPAKEQQKESLPAPDPKQMPPPAPDETKTE